MRKLFSILLLIACVPGCMPRTIVRPNPGPTDQGIRYYRPKPYLLVQPTLNKEDRYVTISLEYLPDFSEEYSIVVKTGLGLNNTSVKLENGWNLTEINQDLDSNVDDNIKAVGELISAAGKFGGTSGTLREGQKAGAVMVVEATNVPLGFYESVVSRGPDGRKRLYGWRYVGFSPFAPCPYESSGLDCHECHYGDVFGLVFRKGVMVFERLQEIGCRNSADVHLVPAEGGSVEALPIPPETLNAVGAKASEIIMRETMATLNASAVVVTEGEDSTSLEVTVTLDKDALKQLKMELSSNNVKAKVETLILNEAKKLIPDVRQIILTLEESSTNNAGLRRHYGYYEPHTK